MNWREEFSKSLLQLGNFAILAVVFNGFFNPQWRWWHLLIGFGAYGVCLLISYRLSRRT